MIGKSYVGIGIGCAATIWAVTACPRAEGQTATLERPVYRVAESRAAATEAAAARTTAAEAQGPFDLTQHAGEHPLAPALRVASDGLAQIDREIQDYVCTLTKRERINGVLGDHQHIFLRVRHQPFSVYMFFLQPNRGQECLYVAGENQGKLIGLGSGLKRKIGPVKLDPFGRWAMAGQKYPITKVGIRNLTDELIQVAQADSKFAECEVRTDMNTKVDGRATTMIQVLHPYPRKNFRFHLARVFIDNELRVPIRYEAYLWPEKPGDPPPLEEEYTYRDLKINNGFTDRDFNVQNPDIFKR